MAVKMFDKRLQVVEGMLFAGPPAAGPPSERVKYFAVVLTEFPDPEQYIDLETWLQVQRHTVVEKFVSTGYDVWLYVNPEHTNPDEFHNGIFTPSTEEPHWFQWDDYPPGALAQGLLN